jgi:hypothetical protein
MGRPNATLTESLMRNMPVDSNATMNVRAPGPSDPCALAQTAAAAAAGVLDVPAPYHKPFQPSMRMTPVRVLPSAILSRVSTVSAGCDASADTAPANAPLATVVDSLILGQPHQHARTHA